MQGGFADVVHGGVHVHKLGHIGLKGVALGRGVAAPRQQGAFHALGVVGRARANAVFLACGLDHFPQRVGLGAVTQKQLKAALLAPARAAQHDGNARKRCLDAAKVANAADGLAKHLGHHVFGLGALNGQGRDIGLAHVHVVAALRGNGAHPEQHVAVGQREPVAVRELEQNRVVQQAALVVAHGHVLALAGLHLAQVARAQVLHQAVSVGARHFHLPLHAHVPHGHAVHQAVQLGGQVAIRGGHEHLVVNAEMRHAVAHRGIKKRRMADARRHRNDDLGQGCGDGSVGFGHGFHPFCKSWGGAYCVFRQGAAPYEGAIHLAS